MLHTKNTQTNQMPFNRLLTYIFNKIKDMGYSKGLSQRNESHTKYNKNAIRYKNQHQYSFVITLYQTNSLFDSFTIIDRQIASLTTETLFSH